MRKINTRNFRLATRSTPREIIGQIVLKLIREHQPISRAELARRMQVHRGTIVNIRAIDKVTRDWRDQPVIALKGRAEKLTVSRTFASASSPPRCAASTTQWAMCSSSSPSEKDCSAFVAADTWVRMSMQYLSSSIIFAMPRT